MSEAASSFFFELLFCRLVGVYYCYKPVYFVVSTLFGLLKVLPPISGLASPPPPPPTPVRVRVLWGRGGGA